MTHHILITGGAGFVGSELMSYLRYRHDLKAVFDIDINPIFNVCDERTLANVVPHYDTIIHLAAIVGEPACIINPELAYNINVGAVKKIVKHMSLSQRLIFMSTSSVYGNRPGEIVNEDTPPIPTNNYARQKFEAEQIIQNNLRNYIIFRPVTAFGVSKRIRLDLLVNTLIYEALTAKEIKMYEPNIIRPMIHVTDFARLIVHALDDHMRWGEIYNIGDQSMTMTKEKLALEIGKRTDASVQYVEGSSLDLRDYNISFDKIRYYNSNTYMGYPITDISVGTDGRTMVYNTYKGLPCMYAPFHFTKDPLDLAVNQIKLRIDDIKGKEQEFNTPERTKRLYERYKDVLQS